MGQLDTDRAARRRQIQMTQDLIAPRASAARGSRRGDRGLLVVEAGALPLLGAAGYHGAMVFLWPAGEDTDRPG